MAILLHEALNWRYRNKTLDKTIFDHAICRIAAIRATIFSDTITADLNVVVSAWSNQIYSRCCGSNFQTQITWISATEYLQRVAQVFFRE